MRNRRLLFICGLTALALLLSAGAAFAQEEDPEPENPVIQFLAGIIGLTPEEIAAQREAGYSLGNIARGFLFNQLTGLDASEVQGESHGHGWGVLFRNAELHPGGGGRGLGWMIGKGHTRTEHPGNRPDHAGGRPPWAGGPPEWAGGPGGNPDE
jgi:hypothetical protein